MHTKEAVLPGATRHRSGCDLPEHLELRKLRKEFVSGVSVVDGIDLMVREGEFVSLLGPSGSGKTTTLRMIAGFEAPTSGEIVLDGRRIDGVPPEKRPVNTVFQDYALFPHLSTWENVAFGLRAQRPRRNDIERRVSEALELVELGDLKERTPSQLSGGQRQRTALARALVLQPRILLLDEPLGALDLQLRKQMQLVLVRLCAQLGTTFIYITHDQEEALAMSDRIAVMRDGIIEQYATPQELYTNPMTKFVAGFVGENNFLAARVVESRNSDPTVMIESTTITVPRSRVRLEGADRNAVIAIRPEAISLCPPRDEHQGLGATVTQVVFLGSQAQVWLRTDGGADLLARLTPVLAQEFIAESRVRVVIDSAAVIVFPEGDILR